MKSSISRPSPGLMQMELMSPRKNNQETKTKLNHSITIKEKPFLFNEFLPDYWKVLNRDKATSSTTNSCKNTFKIREQNSRYSKLALKRLNNITLTITNMK